MKVVANGPPVVVGGRKEGRPLCVDNVHGQLDQRCTQATRSPQLLWKVASPESNSERGRDKRGYEETCSAIMRSRQKDNKACVDR